jgi:hypothetical protein
MTELQQQLLATLDEHPNGRQGLQAAELADLVGEPTRRVAAALAQLRKQGLLVRREAPWPAYAGTWRWRRPDRYDRALHQLQETTG